MTLKRLGVFLKSLIQRWWVKSCSLSWVSFPPQPPSYLGYIFQNCCRVRVWGAIGRALLFRCSVGGFLELMPQVKIHLFRPPRLPPLRARGEPKTPCICRDEHICSAFEELHQCNQTAADCRRGIHRFWRESASGNWRLPCQNRFSIFNPVWNRLHRIATVFL